MPNDSGMPIHLCVQKLRILIEDTDQNCKSPFSVNVSFKTSSFNLFIIF